MMGFREWMKRNAEQTKIAKNRPVSDRNVSNKLSTQKIVKRILERHSAN